MRLRIFFFLLYPSSWFQTFAVIWMLYIFFWVFPRRQIVVGRRFGTLYQFHLQRLCVHTVHPAFEDGTDTGFRKVGQLQFDAGEIPKRKYTIYPSSEFVAWKLQAFGSRFYSLLQGGEDLKKFLACWVSWYLNFQSLDMNSNTMKYRRH